jgi:hypothetical protein
MPYSKKSAAPEVAEHQKKTNVIRKERSYQFFMQRQVAAETGNMVSMSSSDAKPRSLATKLRGNNCEGCHNIGLFISQVAGNVKMLLETFEKVNIGGTINETDIAEFISFLKKLEPHLDFLNVWLTVDRSRSDIEDKLTLLKDWLEKLDDFRSTMFRLWDIGTRFTGLFTLLEANALIQEPKLWRDGMLKQDPYQKPLPQGSALENFCKDPSRSSHVLKLMMKGLEAQLEVTKKKRVKSSQKSRNTLDKQEDDKSSDAPSSSQKSSSADSSSEKKKSKSSKKKSRGSKKSKGSKKKKEKKSSSDSDDKNKKKRKGSSLRVSRRNLAKSEASSVAASSDDEAGKELKKSKKEDKAPTALEEESKSKKGESGPMSLEEEANEAKWWDFDYDNNVDIFWREGANGKRGTWIPYPQ